MIKNRHIRAAGRKLRRFASDQSGAALVEYALVILLFLFLLFAIIDFGRLANAWVAANKATQIAARIAVVRPPVCPGVPDLNVRGPAPGITAFGALCRLGTGICADPGTFTCQGNDTNATSVEIMQAIRPLMPPGTTAENLRFSYSFDPDLGFLGGPYVPMVTVAFTDVDFVFVSQLGRMIGVMTGNTSGLGGDLPMPGMSVSLPAEDLAHGSGG
ncbi:TadE/TadG family type IV pilus assembly protein [Yoonia sp.]|uniref:TadE/TadG family type IV pilus assembly protein n=1 Tax=Yoonia sp. TaxID=2212373 RepID=UPI001A109054|nr:TadE/TadG family type IV pilus assembly protein [Yoonia sp.]MBE0413738.1 pilus assembly protein [Yoonia sp.]